MHCPDSPGLHLMRARHLKFAGHLTEAIDEFNASIRLRPTAADAYIELALTLLALNRVPEGMEEMKRALVAEPDQPVALSALAHHAIISGNEPAAQAFSCSGHKISRASPGRSSASFAPGSRKSLVVPSAEPAALLNAHSTRRTLARFDSPARPPGGPGGPAPRRSASAGSFRFRPVRLPGKPARASIRCPDPASTHRGDRRFARRSSRVSRRRGVGPPRSAAQSPAPRCGVATDRKRRHPASTPRASADHPQTEPRLHRVSAWRRAAPVRRCSRSR